MESEAAAGRQALREITGALGLSVVLLALMVAAVLIADRDAVAALGALALAVALGVGVLVVRRVVRISQGRDATIEQERRGREQLDRTLAATRRLVEIDSPIELRRQICEVARDVFECSAVSLWEVEADTILLLERVPWQHPYAGADRRPIAELPGLRQAIETTQPLYVRDLKEAAAGVTRATAEILDTGSLLNVPVAYGGVAKLDLVLSWNEILPEPSSAQRVAVQRFADQAGLALEQSRYRAAQAEIASLNRTLSRMVQTDPLFHAGGSLEEVAEAVCTEALEVFEADGAALWVEGGECIELVHREPPTDAFMPQTRILFSEHPSFSDDLEAGQPNFLADVEHADPVLWERFARRSGSRSQLRLPLASGGLARAMIVLSWSEPVPPPSAQVSALASRFADQAGVAMAEAARRRAEREAAELHARFERSLLPSIALDSPGVDVATFYRPGDDRLSLGGDFYDCLELDDGSIALLIGDVAGHGVAAAALGAGLRSAWRALVLGGWGLEEIPRGMQSVCVRDRHDPYLFVTAIIALVPASRDRLAFVSAGHPAPLVAGAPAAPDAHNGPPLGIVDDAVWHAATVPLAPRASVLLYTDGLVEGRATPGVSERLGIEPIQQRLAGVAPGTLAGADLRGLVELATEANGAGLPDDVAMLALNVQR
ncbi:MAG: response regulator receiver modulated serine phosphatase [Solirubrobacterales bacterium]|nr:response regulator receiver modulated serine phosphatase [Solirubrobacterales bacterium]